MGLNIIFKKTKTYFINCDTETLSVGHQQIEPVTDFRYLGSMIASPVEDLIYRLLAAHLAINSLVLVSPDLFSFRRLYVMVTRFGFDDINNVCEMCRK